MNVSKSGTGYQVYVQNSYYYEKANNQQSAAYDDSIDKYFHAIQDSIPELKGVAQEEISFHILPDEPSTTKTGNAADDLIGIVPFKYSYSGDVKLGGGSLTINSWDETDIFDTTAARQVRDKIALAYKNNANSLGETYLNNELRLLDKFLANGGVITFDENLKK